MKSIEERCRSYPRFHPRHQSIQNHIVIFTWHLTVLPLNHKDNKNNDFFNFFVNYITCPCNGCFKNRNDRLPGKDRERAFYEVNITRWKCRILPEASPEAGNSIC